MGTIAPGKSLKGEGEPENRHFSSPEGEDPKKHKFKTSLWKGSRNRVDGILQAFANPSQAKNKLRNRKTMHALSHKEKARKRLSKGGKTGKITLPPRRHSAIGGTAHKKAAMGLWVNSRN